MPRGVRSPVPGRPQTLREARRAYQKAGRTPSLSAARIRAAERAAEADRRATEIQAKERRAKESKRRREEQDARKREEQRMLVQLGRLPEDSLWGKVRASQQRLHSFFGAGQHAEVEDKADVTGLRQQDATTGVRISTIDIFNEGVPDPGLGSCSPPAIRSSQEVSPAQASPLPIQNTSVKARICNNVSSVDINRPAQEETVHVMRDTRAQLGIQLPFPGSQLLSNFVDDGDLEAELNGPFSLTQLTQERPAGEPNYAQTSPTQTPSRKRKVDDLPFSTSPYAKATRLVLGKTSPSMLNACGQDKVDTLPKPSSTSSCLGAPSAKYDVLDIPTASQVEAMLGSQDFDDDWQSDKENTNSRSTAPNNDSSGYKIHVLDSIGTKPHTCALSCVIPPKNKRPQAKPSSPVPQGGHENFDYTDFLKEDSEDEFGDDVEDEILEFALEASEGANAHCQTVFQS